MTDNVSNDLLDKAICYLAGPMTFAPDIGVGWRRSLIKQSHQRGIGLNFLDPTNKIKGMKVQDEKELNDKYRREQKWDKLTDHVHAYRREDLRSVDYCDLLIINVDTDIHMCGSYDEVYNAEREHKPRLAIVKGGPAGAPDWLFDVVDWREMFPSVEACVDYLDRINSGEVELDDRWVLIRRHIRYNVNDDEIMLQKARKAMELLGQLKQSGQLEHLDES
jgi:hypothetical protein